MQKHSHRTTSFTAAPVSAPMALSAAWRAAGPLVTPEATIRYVHTCTRRRMSCGHRPKASRKQRTSRPSWLNSCRLAASMARQSNEALLTSCASQKEGMHAARQRQMRGAAAASRRCRALRASAGPALAASAR